MDLRIFHFDTDYHTTTNRVEHIQDASDSSGSALCGYTHEHLGSNGDTITYEWAKQNIPTASNLGTLCKRCAKIAMKKLEEEHQFLEITLHEHKFYEMSDDDLKLFIVEYKEQIIEVLTVEVSDNGIEIYNQMNLTDFRMLLGSLADQEEAFINKGADNV